jgi:hypothetical protein
MIGGWDKRLLIFYKHTLGYGSAILSIGGLFYVQHYPGGQMMSSVGIIIGLYSLLLTIYITFFKRISLLSVSKLVSITMLSFFIWGASGYFMRVSKSVLHSFVGLHDNVTLELENELEFGDRQIEFFKRNNAPDVKKLEFVNQIDKITREHIKFLDALKIEILTEIGEDPTQLKPGPEGIITTAYDEKTPLLPIGLDLTNVINKDKFDEVMRIFGIANDISHPESYKCKSYNVSGGIDLWNSLLKYRSDLCSILVNSLGDSSSSKFVDPKITYFKDAKDLQIIVQNSLKRNKLDRTISPSVEEIYISLSKNEQWESEFYPGGVHWLGKTFDHAPAIAAICVLSNLQKEALSARKMAVKSILNK